jgi:hypothetical protein
MMLYCYWVIVLSLERPAPWRSALEAKFILALKLFELGRLSSGKAGKLCGMGGWNFSAPGWHWMTMS